MSGMLDVVTFVHYRVFASKQTGENEAFYQRGSVGGHALTNNLQEMFYSWQFISLVTKTYDLRLNRMLSGLCSRMSETISS